jgi:phage repressor protein C with HTH and peptisase S24 domain/DNA-binding XRE family transcriptional regulator
MGLGTIIRQRRKELGLTQDKLAAMAGIAKSYLSHIETGRMSGTPSDEVLRAFERALKFENGELIGVAHLGKTPSDVRDNNERLQAEVEKLQRALSSLLKGGAPAAAGIHAEEPVEPRTPTNIRGIPDGVRVPIINKVSAGYPHHFTDLDYPPSVADEYIRCPDLHDPQSFAARVVGDSMEPSYHEGDIVIFSPNTPARSGDDCFVRFEQEGGTTFKRIYQDDEQTIRLQPLNNKYPGRTHPRETVTGLWPAVFRIESLARKS